MGNLPRASLNVPRNHAASQSGVLEERLPVEDHTADVLGKARGREAHGAVGRPVLDHIRDP